MKVLTTDTQADLMTLLQLLRQTYDLSDVDNHSVLTAIEELRPKRVRKKPVDMNVEE